MKVPILIVLLIAIVSLLSCQKEDDCLETDPDPAAICTAIYLPVCGCNGKTYGNACEAEAHGIIQYVEGECL